MPNPVYINILNTYKNFADNILKPAWADLFAHSLMVSSISI